MKIKYIPKYIKNLTTKKNKNFKTEDNLHSIIESELIYASELKIKNTWISSVGNYIAFQKILLGKYEKDNYIKYKNILNHNNIIYIEYKKDEYIYLITSAPRSNYEYIFRDIYLENVYIKSLYSEFNNKKIDIDMAHPYELIVNPIKLDLYNVYMDHLSNLQIPEEENLLTKEDILILTKLYYIDENEMICQETVDIVKFKYDNSILEESVIDYINNSANNFYLTTPTFETDSSGFIFEDFKDDLYSDIDEYIED